eukprot:scaffold2859_cov349-Pavlova_lutheri.AAC.44
MSPLEEPSPGCPWTAVGSMHSPLVVHGRHMARAMACEFFPRSSVSRNSHLHADHRLSTTSDTHAELQILHVLCGCFSWLVAFRVEQQQWTAGGALA